MRHYMDTDDVVDNTSNKELIDKFEDACINYVATLKKCVIIMKNGQFNDEDRKRYDRIAERTSVSIIDFALETTIYSENTTKELLQQGMCDIVDRSLDKNR